MSASKRDELVQKALKVFYQEGFHATGMDKLVAETKISKTSMYKHFRTKEDLILATLRLRDEQFRNFMIRRAQELSSTPEEEILAVFDALSEWFKEDKFKSCMFIKASSEYQNPEHPIHAVSAEHKRLIKVYFKELADKAGLKHTEELSRKILLLKEGAIVIAHLHRDIDPSIDAKEAVKALIDTHRT
ncbi:TetR family transcriptional regulator [Kordiimonas sp. SCSIO 12603]|uniref:TetR/AcrR family transcriptional regulator n=1 Tax=Kordiimonas sp. SCSIO 12603 TaxID=2829596 RepID=UPI002103BECB|nr:TetR family transcriptional regulator [Kordiimonas sp. SCSIO 12603]UTW59007.1 TetR family transcriptional regulator [Kordiimonas sp. SCSIO 12603]